MSAETRAHAYDKLYFKQAGLLNFPDRAGRRNIYSTGCWDTVLVTILFF